MRDLDKDQVITKFTKAYTAANGKAPEIAAKGGWYSVNGEKNVRLAQLDEIADDLAGAKPATKSKGKTNSVAKDVSKAPKAKAKKATKPKSGDFSVKSMWLAKIEHQNPGSIQPR
ncbi:MAG: hypothetical protein ACJA13_001450 [Paraglaciecola sp.]|jgi:hypothetical protein